MAKDRRRRKPAKKKPDPTPDAGDLGLDDASVEDAGLGEISPPDNLQGAMPYADEARAAEGGAQVPEPGETVPSAEEFEDDVDDMERAPDEVEGDLVPAGPALSGDLDPAIAAEAAHPRRKRGRVLTFLGHSIDELRRVQWPNRRQVGQATAVVLGFVVLAGGYLGLMDAIWRPIVERII